MATVIESDTEDQVMNSPAASETAKKRGRKLVTKHYEDKDGFIGKVSLPRLMFFLRTRNVLWMPVSYHGLRSHVHNKELPRNGHWRMNIVYTDYNLYTILHI